MVKNNIALKDGDYPGGKDVSWFWDSILKHVDFLEND